ncbi:unnamed protein product [Ectocarpus sp. 12 AP-2014]
MASTPATDAVEECAICKNDMTGNCNKSTTICGHSFHLTCLARSMNRSPTCPICRTCLVSTTGRDGEADDNGDGHSDGDGDGDGEMKDDSDGFYASETEEEGEVRLPPRTGWTRNGARHEVIVTEFGDDPLSNNNNNSNNNPVLGNEVDLRREILEGIMHSMCRQGDLAEVRNLLDDNPHLQYSRGNTGDLLTHEAVLSDNDSLLSYLLNEKSFDTNLPNDVHVYPLHYAVLSRSLRMVTILVNHRAFVDCAHSSKKTPLMVACEEEDHDIAEFLLDRGASTMTQDACGNQPTLRRQVQGTGLSPTPFVFRGRRQRRQPHGRDAAVHRLQARFPRRFEDPPPRRRRPGQREQVWDHPPRRGLV